MQVDVHKTGVRGIGRLLCAMMVCAGLLAGCSESPEEMVKSAREYLAKNDASAASIQLKNALQQDANIAEARFLLGTISLAQGDVAGAVRDLQRARELGYPAGEIAPHLSRALFLSGAPDRVIADFADTRLDNAEAQAQVLTAVADSYMAKSEFAKARELYDAALASHPGDVRASIGLGRVLLRSGELDAALERADKAIVSNPKVAEAHALRADVLLAMRRNDEAISALETAIAVQPKSTSYHFALITLMLRGEDLDGAEKRLDAMRKVAPKDPMTQYLSAFIEFRRDRLVPARDAIDAVLSAMPTHLPSQLLAGSIYLRLNQHARAQNYLESVLAGAPGQVLARRLLAASLLATGDAMRARELVQPLIDNSDDSDATTLTLAGQIYLAAGDFDSASDFFSKAVAESPDDVGARTRLALARMSSGDTERAFADLEVAASLEGGTGQPEFALVLAHLRRGEYDEALKAQEHLEVKQPGNPQTFNVKGGILMAKRDIPAARAAFERALELDPGFLSAVVNLARIDIAEGKANDAIARFERSITAKPEVVDTYLLLAELQVRTGAAPSAILATLERAQNVNPSSISAKLAVARFHVSQRDTAKALVIVQEVIAANPNDPTALGELAQVQIAMGDRQQAIATYNRLMTLQPTVPQHLLAVANLQLQGNDRSAASQSLRKALALRPDLLEAQQRLHALLLQDGKYAEAVALAREVQKQNPNAVTGFVMEADTLMARQEWSAAAKVYATAFEKAPSGDLAIRLHAARSRPEMSAEADKVLLEWIAKNPSDVVSRGYSAERAIAEKRFEDAERYYREVVELSPNNALALNNLAWVAGELGRADAIDLAQRGLSLAPDNPAILDTLGVLLIKKGESEKGLSMLERAVELAPNSGALKLNLAKAYVNLGKNDEARKRLDELLQQVPAGSPLHVEATRLREGL